MNLDFGVDWTTGSDSKCICPELGAGAGRQVVSVVAIAVARDGSGQGLGLGATVTGICTCTCAAAHIEARFLEMATSWLARLEAPGCGCGCVLTATGASKVAGATTGAMGWCVDDLAVLGVAFVFVGVRTGNDF